jgi:hypothetical protein
MGFRVRLGGLAPTGLLLQTITLILGPPCAFHFDAILPLSLTLPVPSGSKIR